MKKLKVSKKYTKYNPTKHIYIRISGERHTTRDLKKYPSRVVAYPRLAGFFSPFFSFKIAEILDKIVICG